MKAGHTPADYEYSTRTFDVSRFGFESAGALEAVAQAASLGLGITQVWIHHAWSHLRSGNLKVVPLGLHDPGSYEMVMQFPHRALMAPRVRATIDYLLAAFAQDEELHVPLTS